MAAIKTDSLTATQQRIRERHIVSLEKNRALRFKKVYDAVGYTEAEVEEKIREINSKGIVRMTLLMYAKYEVFRYEDKALEDFLKLIAHRNLLKNKILTEFKHMDSGTRNSDDIKALIDEYYQIIEEIMPESLYEELAERLLLSYPNLKGSNEKYRRAAIDMEATRVLLSFSLTEYVVYHFYEKDLFERWTFISDEERLRVINKINDPKCFDMLDNKWMAYNLLRKYYGRKITLIKSEEDFKAFKGICKRNKFLVLKPPCGTQGQGIKAVRVPFGFKKRALFETLTAEDTEILVEELIKPHKKISALNPDSVNTVRLVTYYDGKETSIQNAFMKVGQKGSFIDNGAAGGILVSINTETGMLDSDGRDENGIVYKQHPHTHIIFNGYQLPDWNKAIALGHELADKVPGLKYVGWDITYTDDNQWIVVEGNAKTQFMGQQAPTDKGIRKEFLEAVKYKTKK